MAAWPVDRAEANPSSFGEYFWCACHGDIKSDMEDVALESLWEDLLETTGNGFDNLSMDPIRQQGGRAVKFAGDALGAASGGLLGARSSSDDFAADEAEAALAGEGLGAPRREASGKSPRMSAKVLGWLLTPPDAARKRASAAENGRERAPSRDEVAMADFAGNTVVGTGTFSTVILVKKVADPHRGREFAIKRIPRTSPAVEKRARKEREVLSLCRGSPFTIHCRFAFHDGGFRYIATDYYRGGNIEDQLSISKRGCFAEKRAMFHGVEILLAIKHMHEQGVCHRDLKLNNVLMGADGHVVVADMGFAKSDVRFCEERLTTFCGTIECVAPELLRGQPYGFMVDWWAFGILLFQMIVGKTPFHHASPRQMFSWILKSPPPTTQKATSPAALATITQLLRKEANTRLGYGAAGGADVMASPMFHGVSFSKMAIKAIPVPFKPRAPRDSA